VADSGVAAGTHGTAAALGPRECASLEQGVAGVAVAMLAPAERAHQGSIPDNRTVGRDKGKQTRPVCAVILAHHLRIGSVPPFRGLPCRWACAGWLPSSVSVAVRRERCPGRLPVPVADRGGEPARDGVRAAVGESCLASGRVPAEPGAWLWVVRGGGCAAVRAGARRRSPSGCPGCPGWPGR
jgi:hypothetical protein